jgi:hypothetical protein
MTGGSSMKLIYVELHINRFGLNRFAVGCQTSDSCRLRPISSVGAPLIFSSPRETPFAQVWNCF